MNDITKDHFFVESLIAEDSILTHPDEKRTQPASFEEVYKLVKSME